MIKRMRLTVWPDNDVRRYMMKLRIECDCGNVLKARQPISGLDYKITCSKCDHTFELSIPC